MITKSKDQYVFFTDLSIEKCKRRLEHSEEIPKAVWPFIPRGLRLAVDIKRDSFHLYLKNSWNDLLPGFYGKLFQEDNATRISGYLGVDKTTVKTLIGLSILAFGITVYSILYAATTGGNVFENIEICLTIFIGISFFQFIAWFWGKVMKKPMLDLLKAMFEVKLPSSER